MEALEKLIEAYNMSEEEISDHLREELRDVIENFAEALNVEIRQAAGKLYILDEEDESEETIIEPLEIPEEELGFLELQEREIDLT
jgi:RecB family endonuclease NucS